MLLSYRYFQIFENLSQCQQCLGNVNSVDLSTQEAPLDADPKVIQRIILPGI